MKANPSLRRDALSAILYALALNLPAQSGSTAWQAFAGSAPVFTQHPQSVAVMLGGTVRLVCSVEGSPNPSLVWQKNGAFLPQDTNATLVISNAQPAHAGLYRLVASNDDGLTQSDPAVLCVDTNPPCNFPWVWMRKARATETECEARVHDMARDSQGSIFVTGPACMTGSTSEDWLTMKFSPAGEVLWTAVYDGGTSNPDWPYDLELDAAGNCIVTGTSFVPPNNFDYLTIKYAPNGEELWRATFNSTTNLSNPNDTTDVANGVAVDSLGSAYIVGSRGTLKYDPSGQPLWTNVIGGAFLTLSTNDRTLLTVRGDTLRKLSSDGTQAWEAPLTNVAGVRVDAVGNIYCAARPGVVSGGNWGRIETVKFDKDGQRVWTSLYYGGFGSAPHAMTMDDAGNIYVAGVVYRSPTPLPGQEAKFDWLTLKYRPDGTLAWQAAFNDVVAHENIPLTLAVDGVGDVYVAGTVAWESWGGPREALLMKYDALGNFLWTSKYRIGPYAINSYNRLVIADDGTIVAAGESTYPTQNGWRQEFLITSFDQSSPRLTIGRPREAGVRQVCLVSPRWSQFEIQATTDLPATNWQSLGILTNLNGLVPLWDREVDNHPMRFYRARQAAP